ncbi:hypothetical protein TSUD_351260 [Trifolium subterraneum]|uniref:Uncharacterized protein n=1 Tax=Trifolium subterraneum TaxID=3900 RepID=A0A2Z6P8X2_TRISU|nr:hypothetical protein TSUD_351260 [Trifolium subterraneum]
MLQSIPTLPLNLVDFSVIDCESLETVLSSMEEPYDKPNPCTVLLRNCKKLDPHSYHTVLNNAIAGIEHGPTGEDNTIQYLLVLPHMPGRECPFHYRSTQVSFTLELPPNLVGFAYYLVLTQGFVGEGAHFGCECYLDSSSGESERICITRFPRADIFQYCGCCGNETIIYMWSDHVVLWYDPVTCKEIMEAVEKIKAINDKNSTGYNPKLTFSFFIDESVYDNVVIQECGFRWIYKKETVPPTRKLKQHVFGTPMPSLELDETKGLR